MQRQTPPDAEPRWTSLPHARGEPAQPKAQAWLARNFGGGAGDYPFARDAHGRPRVQRAGLDCNWSHSGDVLLVACAAGLDVGVDVETLRPRANAMALARRYFADSETAWLSRRDDVESAFLRLWCAKEAVLKAHGRGLAFGLDRLAFAERDGALLLERCDAGLGDARDWRVREFAPTPGMLAALAWRTG